jgi:hypothetical protein
MICSSDRDKLATRLKSLSKPCVPANEHVHASGGVTGDGLMRGHWTRTALTQRIDRCYRVAAWTKAAEKRMLYLRLARYYRGLLAAICSPVLVHDNCQPGLADRSFAGPN